MNASDDLRLRVTKAQDRVHSALTNWKAGNLASAGGCCDLLRTAVAELAAAQRAAQIGDEYPGMKAQLEQIREEVVLMTRLVDASAAFCRGLALSIGDEAVLTAGQPGADEFAGCEVHA